MTDSLFLCQDHDFFQHVEMHLRSEHPPLCGRDHLSFRSYYFPVKVGLSWKLELKKGILSIFNQSFSLGLPPLKIGTVLNEGALRMWIDGGSNVGEE